MSAKSRRLAVCLLCALPFFAGCLNRNKAPEDKTITTQIEQSFKQRWIEHRSTELVGQGVAPDEARTRAIIEFRQRYEYTGAAHE